MEGTMDSRRLTLSRPTPRPVAPRVSAASTDKKVAQASVASTDTKDGQSHFSKLTPIYQSGPVNTVSDIVSPRVKGIEFIKVSTKKSNKVPDVQVTPAQNVQQAVSAELSDEGTYQDLEYFENNLDTVDLDLIGNPIDDDVSIAGVFGAATTAVQYQPANFIEQYFQQNSEKTGAKHLIKKLVPKVNLKNISPKHARRIGLFSVLAGIVAFGSYVVIDSFLLNQQAKAELGQDTSQAAVTPAITETSTDNATQTTTPPPADPAQTAPAAASGAGSSAVAADQPKYITIKKLNIHAPVVSVGLTSAGAINTPTNIWNAAWYNGSAKPGDDGAALIDGHSSATHGALFGNLDELAVGDQIQVQRGDGSILNYRVAYTAIVDRNAVDMASMLKPYGGASKGLNIITCIGQWITSEETLQNRLLVYTQQI